MTKIIFPHLLESRQILLRADFMKQMQPIEKHFRYKDADPNTALLEFTDVEKQTIAWYFSILVPLLMKNGQQLLTDNIKFLKLKRGIEWDCPFSIGTNTIVLSEKILETATSGKCNSIDRERFCEVLTHELVHLHQRRHPNVYENIYTTIFGFIKRKVALSDNLAQYIVTNPDGPQYEWIMPFRLQAKLKFMLPIAMINEVGTPSGVLVELTSNNGKLFHEISNTVIPINSYPLYYNLFGVKNQLYHPNEIIAHIISEYIVQGHMYHTSTFKSPILYRAIDRLLGV